jgi:uncharacterized protein CbrC (UPF0167 family)
MRICKLGLTMTTFAELGIPFPLFEAPTSEASNYVGLSSCRLCEAKNRHCFALGIGRAVILPCPTCGVENGLDAQNRQDCPCRSCGSTVSFSASMKKQKNLHICYDCLRSGRGAITKDTEFGMVSWEQAYQGITHGVPGLETTEFERVLINAGENWYGVRVPQEYLFELLRTPTFNTWQGERWVFCCKRPMTYIGEWSNVLKSSRRAGDKAFFDEVVHPAEESKAWVWDAIELGSGSVCLYIFQCKTCNRFRSNWDMD